MIQIDHTKPIAKLPIFHCWKNKKKSKKVPIKTNKKTMKSTISWTHIFIVPSLAMWEVRATSCRDISKPVLYITNMFNNQPKFHPDRIVAFTSRSLYAAINNIIQTESLGTTYEGVWVVWPLVTNLAFFFCKLYPNFMSKTIWHLHFWDFIGISNSFVQLHGSRQALNHQANAELPSILSVTRNTA
jgi:hypothetical protein